MAVLILLEASSERKVGGWRRGDFLLGSSDVSSSSRDHLNEI